ncbi:MAG: LysR family transcriptional regulator [Pseudomonadota bacterium]
MDATLSLREMEVLHAVVNTGTMSAAGRQLRISQPAVSQLVGAAERRLGVSLFMREGNRLVPTAELLELQNELQLVFRNVDSARRLAALLNQGAGRVVRIGATPALATAFLPDAVAALVDRYPNVKALIRIQEPSPIKNAVVARDFDIGLVYAETGREGIDTTDLCEAPVVCLMMADHPLARKAALTPRDLSDHPLISFSHMSQPGVSLDEIFAEAGARRNVVVQTGNSYMSVEFVRSGLGIALADPFILGGNTASDIVARPFEPTRLLRPRAVHIKDRQLSAAEQHLIACLHDAAQAWLGRNAHMWQSGQARGG